MKCFVFAAVLVALATASLPTSFDARQKWSNCAFTILDQGHCGSCWDFASMEAFGDRLCVSGEAPSGTLTSVEPPLECTNDKGCGGGSPSVAWNWVIANGNPTCTQRCTSGCAPYDLYEGPWIWNVPDCHAAKTGAQTCDSGSKWPVTYHASEYKSLARDNINLFMTELSDNGPLQACFTEYNNFGSFFHHQPYGIYNSTAGASSVGGHCVKIIGWGHESGMDYWLIANSWGTGFANKGYFKFMKGHNLCNMEHEMSEGFTQKQGVALREAEAKGHFIPTDDTPDEQRIGGGKWYKQPEHELANEFLVDAGKAAVRLDGRFSFKAVTNARTQSAAGVNYELVVMTEEGVSVEFKLRREFDLRYKLHGADVLKH